MSHYPAQPYSDTLDYLVNIGPSNILQTGANYGQLASIGANTLLGNALGSPATAQSLSVTAARLVLGLGTTNSPSFNGLSITGKGTLGLPSGTTAERVATQGIRWNSDTGRHEFYDGLAWYNHARLTGDTFTGQVVGPSFVANGVDNAYGTNTVVISNLAGARILSTTNDGRVGVGANPTLDVAFEVNMSGAKTTGNVAAFRNASGNLLVNPTVISTSAANFAFGANNNGSAINMVAPINYALNVYGTRVHVGSSGDTTGQFGVVSAATGTVAGVFRGASGQTADLLQCQNSAGTSLVRVSSAGIVTSENGARIANNKTIEFARTTGYVGWFNIGVNTSDILTLSANNASLSLDPVSGTVTSAGGIAFNDNLKGFSWPTGSTVSSDGAANVIFRNPGAGGAYFDFGTAGLFFRDRGQGYANVLTCAAGASGAVTVLRNLIAPTVMLGDSTGPLLRNNAGVIETRNNSNTALGILATGTFSATQTGSGSSGTQVVSQINATYNQTGTAGSDTFQINRFNTGLGSGSQNFINCYDSGTSRFSVSNAGNLNLNGTIQFGSSSLFRINGTQIEARDSTNTVSANLLGATVTAETSLRTNNITRNGVSTIQVFNANVTSAFPMVTIGTGSLTNSSGVAGELLLNTTVNQTGTAGSTNLLINRTETALGSGAHNFADFQVANTSRFRLQNDGGMFWSDVRVQKIAKTWKTECFESSLSAWQTTSTECASPTGPKWAVFNTTPVAQQVAVPNTTGAILGVLEMEVNKIKDAIRAYGLIAP